MFYRPKEGHGLPHNPFGAIVSPRPIGWIGSRGHAGDNLAPYSFFNAVAYAPPQVMFASIGRKDTLRNLEETGVFSVQIVEAAMIAAMNASSAALAQGQDEFALTGLEKAECQTIDCPRLARAPAVFECQVSQILALKGRDNHLVLGEVTGVHLRDDCLVEGRFDVTRFRPVSRLGYMDYAVIDSVFELARPD